MAKKKKEARVPDLDIELEVFITENSRKRRKCAICNDEALPTIRKVLEKINEKKAYSITLQKIFQKICEIHPGFEDRVGTANFRCHLAHHEPSWHRYKGERAY